MARNNSTRNSGSTRLPRLPALGATLWTIREDHLKLSRSKAYQRHAVSQSYLFNIEVHGTVPTLETLDRLIDGYNLPPLLARHLRDLRTPPECLAPASKLRDSVTSNHTLLNHLDDLERRSIIAAYVDPLWNVLACTEPLRANLPGIEDTWSVPAWTFSPAAKRVIVDWEHEAAHTVATLRVALGRYRDSEQARQLMHRLRPNLDFQRLWNGSIDVAYSRDSSNLLHIRDPLTETPGSYLLAVADVDQSRNIQLLTAIGKPYSGPST